MAAIELLPLRPDEFEDARGRTIFEQIMEAATARPAAGDEGNIRATTAALSDDEATDLAQLVIDLDTIYRPIA